MDRLEAMSAFVAVVEAGGFSAAGRGLGAPLTTVSLKGSWRRSENDRQTSRMPLETSGLHEVGSFSGA
jgi:hypothetical protein